MCANIINNIEDMMIHEHKLRKKCSFLLLWRQYEDLQTSFNSYVTKMKEMAQILSSTHCFILDINTLNLLSSTISYRVQRKTKGFL